MRAVSVGPAKSGQPRRRMGHRLAAAVVLLTALLLAAGAYAEAYHNLSAHGSRGWIRFWGDGTVDLKGKGTLIVLNASNCTIKMDGTWDKVNRSMDGAEYSHFEGTVHCVGLGTHLEIRGWNLSIEAKGRGKAWFQGSGVTVLDGGQEQRWPDAESGHSWLKIKFRD
jgi:hypothetical protein